MDWRVKVAVQFALGQCPGGWWLNAKLSDLYRGMGELRGLVRQRASEVAWAERSGLCIEGAQVVEIGTGRWPVAALLLSLLGARTVDTYDRRPLLDRKSLRSIVSEFEILSDELAILLGRPREMLACRLRWLREVLGGSDLLEAGHIRYHAPAETARTRLPDRSTDALVSFDVFEHLRPDLLASLQSEARRLIRPGGCQFHTIGLGDHYGGVDGRLTSVNFLRYPDRWWDFFTGNELSYHNRLRWPQYLDLLNGHGFQVVSRNLTTDLPALEALRTMKLDRRFCELSPNDLAIARATVLAQRV